MSREIKYNISHLDLFNFENKENLELLKIQTEYSHDALTLIIDDIPIIAIGLIRINKQAGNIWMVKSKYISKHKIFIVKRLKVLIDFYAKKYKLKRIQTLITPENQKWIECLGFEKESELKNFSDETTYLYRRLFKWE